MTEIRLLACGQCRTVQVLEDFKGPVEYDEVLAVAVSKHKNGTVEHAPAALLRIDESDWKKPGVAQEVTKRIQESMDPESPLGLPSAAYEMLDNFKADAMQCWAQHLRTPDCNDYMSPAKRLVPDTKKERKELGLNPRYDAQNPELTRHLCLYCPVHSLVQQSARKKAGLYDE